MRPARAVALVLAVVALGTLNAMAWQGRTVTTTTTTEVTGPLGEQVSAGKSSPEPAPADQLVELGRNLFRAKGCAACHVDMNAGPSLSNLEQRAGKTKDNQSAEQYVRESIIAPNAFKAAGANGVGEMPTLPVDAAELNALIAYLFTL